MKAPNNKPTDKTEKRLSQDGQPLLSPDVEAQTPPLGVPKNKYIQVDLQTILDKVIKDKTIQQEMIREVTKQLDTEESVETLKGILSEYFSAFIIMGYDVNGERMVINYSPTDRDEDSIIEMVRHVLIQMLQED